MAVKVSGVEVVSDSRQLANISGLDATTKASLESGLTNVNAATLDGIDSTGFATAAQGVTADSALQPEDIGVSVQGYNASTVVDASYVHTDNNYTTAEKSKLSGIEAGATADQTITAGAGLTGGGTGNVTLSHADTSSQASVDNTGATVIQDVTLDTYGHVTGLASATLTAATVGALSSTNPVIAAGTITEDVYTISGTSVALEPDNGSIQLHTLTGNTTYTDAFSAGQAITLMIDDGSAFTVTWPTMTWVNNAGAAPTLATTGYTVVALWKVGSTLYGAMVGNGS